MSVSMNFYNFEMQFEGSMGNLFAFYAFIHVTKTNGQNERCKEKEKGNVLGHFL